MDFSYTISLLTGNIHPIPEDRKAEVDKVIEILTQGKGYLTIGPPVKVVFYDKPILHSEV